MNDVGIYCIENVINHKKYIGQSVHIQRRWYEHKYELNKNVHDNNYLQKAWNKYGCDNFKFYIIEICDEKDLNDKENYYISLYNTMDDKYGYNLKIDGANRLISESTREKLIQAARKKRPNKDIFGSKNPMFGKHLSEDAKNKIRESRVGTKASDETKSKLSEMRSGTNNPRCVSVYCPELNETFWGAKEAELKYGVNRNKISECINGKRKHAGVHPTTGEKLSWIKLENKNS